MYPVSNKYKNEILRSGRQTKSYIVIDNIKYDSTNNLKSYPKIENNASSLFGGFPSKSYEMNLINYDNVLDLKNKEIQTYMGLKYFDEDIVKEGKNIDVDLDYGMKSKLELIGNIYQDLTPILPKQYTQLDYIEGTGSQYIDLGYPFGTTSKVEISIDVERSVIDGKGGALFGARSNTDDGYAIWGNISDNNKMRWDVKTHKTGNGVLIDGNNIVIKDGFKNYLNGINVSANTTVEDFEPKYNSYLLAINTAGGVTNIMPAKIRYFKAWIDGTLKYNCLPAKRISDGEIGLYNLVDGTFFTSASSTSFISGNEVTFPNLNNQREVRACGDNIQLFNKDDNTIIYNYRLDTTGNRFNGDDIGKESFISEFISIDSLTKYAVNYSVNAYTRIAFYDENKTFISKNDTLSNFETPQNAKYFRFCNLISKINEIKISKGTSTGGYSRYGQGSITVKKSNKNIYQLSEEEISFTVNGVTFTAKNNKLTINGTSTATIERTSFKNKFEKIKLNGKYYLSEKYSGTLPSGCYTGLSYTSNYYNSIDKGLLNVNNEFAVSLYIPSGKTFENYTIEYQLEEGTVATEPILHQGKTYIVPTQQPFYEGDTFVKVANVWYEKHIIDEKILKNDTGILSIELQSINNYGIANFLVKYSNVDIYTQENVGLSNMLKTQLTTISNTSKEGILLQLKNDYIRINKDRASTVDEFKQLLDNLYEKGTPLKVYHVLKTPIFIKCTDDQNAILDELDNLFLYDGVNHIYSMDEISPDLKMTIEGTEYIPQGTCIVQEIEDSKTKRDITVKGNDYAIKFNEDYDSSQFEFPMIYTEFVNKICDVCGVKVKNIEDLHFANTILNEQPNFNETETKYRQIINWIAEANLCIAIIGKDDQLQFVTRYTTDINIDKYYHTDLSVNHKFGPINSLVISRLDTDEGTTTEDIYEKDDESIAVNGLQEYKIVDNPFLYYNREEVIKELFELIKGQEWYDFSCKHNGHPELDINDVIGVTDRFEKTIYTPILNLTINNRIAGNLKNEISIENKTKYAFAGSISKRVKKVEYEVDKANGEIRSLVESTNRLEGNEVTTNNNFTDIYNKLGDTVTKDDMVDFTNRVTTLETDTQRVINITKDIQVNGVSKVTTTTGFTLDEKGFNIEKTGAPTASLLNEKALIIKDNTGSSQENLLFAGYDEEIGETIVKSKNMTVEKYLTVGKYSRIEDYQEGTGVFWVGGKN